MKGVAEEVRLFDGVDESSYSMSDFLYGSPRFAGVFVGGFQEWVKICSESEAE